MKFKAYWANKTPLRYLTVSCLPQDNRITNSSEPKKMDQSGTKQRGRRSNFYSTLGKLPSSSLQNDKKALKSADASVLGFQSECSCPPLKCQFSYWDLRTGF